MTTVDDRESLRSEVRGWLEANPTPTASQLAERGLVAPHWPRPWGLGADAASQLVVDDELRRAGVSRPLNPIGIGWAGPTLLAGGTNEQQARWLPGILSGSAFWCQLFSEPDAGSDLASLRTRAVRDGDEWIVTGQKIWTSYAHIATYGIRWHAPILQPRSTRGSLTSSAPCTSMASRSVRSST